MFSTMGSAVEVLYGNNLGFEDENSIFSLVSDVLRIERQLQEWETTLPAWLQPGRFEASNPGHGTAEALRKRFQSNTAVRHNYMHALIHRPVVLWLLVQAAKHQSQNDTQDQLRGVGQRSLDVCIESSMELVSCVYATCKMRAQKSLLGTWWCSLYFSKWVLPCFPMTGRAGDVMCFLINHSFHGGAEYIRRLLAPVARGARDT